MRSLAKPCIVAVALVLTVLSPTDVYAQINCEGFETSNISVIGTLLEGKLIVSEPNTSADTDSQTDAVANSIKSSICQPTMKIRIPGLTFTPADEVAESAYRTPEGDVNIFVPFIGEYLVAIYLYAIVVLVVIAVVALIASGVQWLISAGNDGVIQSAKSRMLNIIIALVLMALSYTILYTINPDLTTFRSISLLYINRKPVYYSDSTSLYPSGPVGSTGNPQRLCGNEGSKAERMQDCARYCKADRNSIAPTQGMIGIEQTVSISEEIERRNLVGLYPANGSIRVDRNLIQPLALAGQEAARRGYGIRIASGWRSIQKQLDLACPGILDGTFNSAAVAWPGGSNHGGGNAVDISLINLSRQRLSGTQFSTQNNPEFRPYNRILAEIMFSAGWMRYTKEVWHFEYPQRTGQFRTSGDREECFETSCD